MRACAETLEPETSPAELAALTDLLKGAGLDGRHLEIGTAAGGTLRELLASYPADRRPPFVVIDPMSYFPDQLGTVRRNLAERGVDPDGVEFRVGFSQDEFPKAAARGERFQFVFIDGDHSATGVMRDMMWARLLEVGGYLCLHDVGPRSPDVLWVVARFLRKYPNYEKVAHVGTMLALRKRAPSAEPEISGLDRLLAHPVKMGIKWRRSLRRRLGNRAAS